jgi:NAD(P)-dependent dehydrogenase (short-subunit alcohol dehydrogenase family)
MDQPRTLLISGASRGIGRAIAERALAEGHRLSLGVRDPAGLPAGPLLETARLNPDQVLSIPPTPATPARPAPGWRRPWPSSAASMG